MGLFNNPPSCSIHHRTCITDINGERQSERRKIIIVIIKCTKSKPRTYYILVFYTPQPYRMNFNGEQINKNFNLPAFLASVIKNIHSHSARLGAPSSLSQTRTHFVSEKNKTTILIQPLFTFFNLATIS